MPSALACCDEVISANQRQPRTVSPRGSYNDPDRIQHLPFLEAAAKWHDSRTSFIKPSTHKENGFHVCQLAKFFEGRSLASLRATDLRKYQDARRSNAGALWSKPSGPSLINHELSVLQQMMKHAGLWRRISDHYAPLPLPNWKPPKVMTEEEERNFFRLAGTKPEWRLACLVAMLTVNTTCAGAELRNLRWEDVDLVRINSEGNADAVLSVPYEGAKNGFRARRVPLNTLAVQAMQGVMERAKELGSSRPEHFLFPFRVCRNTFDPMRPASASWLRYNWHQLRRAAKLPWLTPHCLRYQAITLLYELGIPEADIQNFAGHSSARMSREYNQTRHAKLRAAAEALGHAECAARELGQSARVRRCVKVGPVISFAGRGNLIAFPGGLRA